MSNIFGNHGHARDGDIITHVDMPCKACTAANHAALANRGTPSNTHTGGNCGTCANLYVMSNLYQVIDNHVIANEGIIERATVNTSMATHSHMIANHHTP